MNAPEKLYFPEDGLPRYIDWDGSPIRTKQVEDSDICYICKDALLEWLNKQFVETVDKRDFHRNCAFSEVIEKLNSM